MPLRIEPAVPFMPLTVKNGVAAIDPVTLRLAVRTLSAESLHVTAPPMVEYEAPSEFAALSTINLRRGFISVLINTEQMTWALADDYEAQTSGFADYSEHQYRLGVDVGLGRVVTMPGFHGQDARIATFPMRLRDGALVDAWFTQLPSERDEVDASELAEIAVHAMAAYRAPGAVAEDFDHVIVPKLDFSYTSAALTAAVRVKEWRIVRTRQKFRVTLDEIGARVEVMSIIREVGVPEVWPTRFEFGAGGPVVLWFSAGESGPFCVVYTEADAWEPDPDENW